MSTKESGRTTRLMEREYIQKMTVQVIQANGMRIFSMVMVLKDGPTVHPTRGIN